MSGGYNQSVFGIHYNIHIEDSKYSSYFWYDQLGRMILSQNSKQHNTGAAKRYSYTLYDALGRVYEVGEKTENSTLGNQFKDIFGAFVSDHYNPRVIHEQKYLNWIDGNGDRKYVTRSYYDENHISGLPNTFEQDHLRNRVAHITYEDEYDGVNNNYEYASHFSYDIHGNVKSILQDNQKLANSLSAVEDQRFKRMDYQYDLISGNVLKVYYQKDSLDQWAHRYDYDGDNRIRSVETSRDDITWDLEAKYFYYHHGPLARVEYGKNKVQGADYAYTLQGWIKAVNGDGLVPEREPGKDGYDDATNPNKNIARDAFGYSLGYFTGDYQPVNTDIWTNVEDRFIADINGSDLEAQRNNLYNGNISHMVTSIPDHHGVVQPNAFAYKYDQLNRLKQARAFDNIDLEDNVWNSGSTYAGRYENLFEYDANGNITSQIRKDAVGNPIDELTYQYAKVGGKLHHNRLYHLNDNVSSSAFDDDIDDMGTFGDANLSAMMLDNNYVYDAIGNLIRDEQEEIDSMIWRPDGKLEKIIRSSSSGKLNLKFDYDVSGNRIAKHVIDNNDELLHSTYYVRDAQGNVMSVYKLNIDTVQQSLAYFQKERHIYGSSMLGMDTDSLEMIGASVADTTLFSYLVGNKRYQMSNHLGNVLAVVTDKKIPIDLNQDTIVDYYLPEIYSTSHYSPFGVELTCETALDPETDFDLIEEDVIYSHFQNTGLDSNGNLQTTDTANGQWDYYGARGQQVVMQGEYIECEIGNEGLTYNHNVFVGLVYNFTNYHPITSIDYAWYFYHSGSNTMWKDGVNIASASGGKFKAGDKFKIERKNDSIYYYKNNTLEITVVDDYPTTPLEIVTALLKENTKVYNLKVGKLHANNFCSKDSRYRYSFNFQEKVSEIAPGHLTAEFWEYDPRSAKRWNIDPKPNPSISNYATFTGNPIYYTDHRGDTTYRFNEKGSFLGMADLDITGIQGSIGTYNNSEKTQTWQSDRYFKFNDDATDREQLNSLAIGQKGLTIVSDENINWVMNNSDIKNRNFLSRWDFAAGESVGGRMDFNMNYTLPSQGFDNVDDVKNYDQVGGFMLFGTKNTAYNLNDAGQFLWGQAMNRLGFDYSTAQAGSQTFALGYEFGWDSPADQKAIREGYHYKPVIKLANSGGAFSSMPEGGWRMGPRRR